MLRHDGRLPAKGLGLQLPDTLQLGGCELSVDVAHVAVACPVSSINQLKVSHPPAVCVLFVLAADFVHCGCINMPCWCGWWRARGSQHWSQSLTWLDQACIIRILGFGGAFCTIWAVWAVYQEGMLC